MEEFIIFLSTYVASTETFFIAIALIVLDLFRRKQYKTGIFVVAATLTLTFLVSALKYIFAVSRPTDALVTLTSYAFPSGHAASVVFFAAVFWVYLTKLYRLPKVWVSGLLFLLVILVGYSRLYLGVHTIDQVIAGYAVGLFVSSLFLWRVSLR